MRRAAGHIGVTEPGRRPASSHNPLKVRWGVKVPQSVAAAPGRAPGPSGPCLLALPAGLRASFPEWPPFERGPQSRGRKERGPGRVSGRRAAERTERPRCASREATPLPGPRPPEKPRPSQLATPSRLTTPLAAGRTLLRPRPLRATPSREATPPEVPPSLPSSVQAHRSPTLRGPRRVGQTRRHSPRSWHSRTARGHGGAVTQLDTGPSREKKAAWALGQCLHRNLSVSN